MNIEQLRKQSHKILIVGSYPPIIQSMLDFDFISGKSEPSVAAILATGRKSEKYFFGKSEMLIPVYSRAAEIPKGTLEKITLFANVVSGRRVFDTTFSAFKEFPNVLGGVIFAEDVPEKHAVDLADLAYEQGKFLIGPASVGLLIPKVLKLGAVGGVDSRQLVDSHLFSQGSVAVFSASGGMTNELIRIVAQSGNRLSFALAFGGDRFPATTPRQAFLAAENDPQTSMIVYFGELGGCDEYEIVRLLKTGKVKKKVISYIAGTVAELFSEPPQFGHAKAMAKTHLESAKAKREALREAGAVVPESFTEFVNKICENKEKVHNEHMDEGKIDHATGRSGSLLTSSISGDINGITHILGEDMLSFAKNHTFAYDVASLFLGKKIKSKELEQFLDFILRLLLDHGPYTSGAVNTIITARAGKDLSSALAAGLLTIGPRFGGAVNQAALNWLTGVSSGENASEFVENLAKNKVYIAGIGHRKYRADIPDPRVKEILKYADNLETAKYTRFAKEVEKVTTQKKGNLILNVDGSIAAVLLDILSEKEGYSKEALENLAHNEFFNAVFIASRSIGLIAHFMDQKRLDEGLFRLSPEHVHSPEK